MIAIDMKERKDNGDCVACYVNQLGFLSAMEADYTNNEVECKK